MPVQQLYKNGEPFQQVELNPTNVPIDIPEQIYNAIRIDTLKWLIESGDPEFNISLGGRNAFTFKRAIVNVKTHGNGWIQYKMAICELWDEVITIRGGMFTTESFDDAIVAKNEILTASYPLQKIPLGYK